MASLTGNASNDQRLDFGLNMETLGLNFSEKPFCDVSEHEFFDVWDSDINSVRKSTLLANLTFASLTSI